MSSVKEVTFQSGDLSLHATIAIPHNQKQSLPGVILFHGMTSSEKSYIALASSLAEIGIAGLAVSMRGHGESEGDFNKATVAEAISDGLAAYDFLATQQGIDARRIGMVGSSVGAIIVTMTSSHRNVQSLILRAPAAYTNPMMHITMAQTMVNESKQFHEIDNLEDTPAGKAITKFTGSLFVAASENDIVIPLTISKGYINIAKQAKKKQLTIIKGADHPLTDPNLKEKFNRMAVDWFTNTLLNSR